MIFRARITEIRLYVLLFLVLNTSQAVALTYGLEVVHNVPAGHTVWENTACGDVNPNVYAYNGILMATYSECDGLGFTSTKLVRPSDMPVGGIIYTQPACTDLLPILVACHKKIAQQVISGFDEIKVNKEIAALDLNYSLAYAINRARELLATGMPQNATTVTNIGRLLYDTSNAYIVGYTLQHNPVRDAYRSMFHSKRAWLISTTTTEGGVKGIADGLNNTLNQINSLCGISLACNNKIANVLARKETLQHEFDAALGPDSLTLSDSQAIIARATAWNTLHSFPPRYNALKEEADIVLALIQSSPVRAEAAALDRHTTIQGYLDSGLTELSAAVADARIAISPSMDEFCSNAESFSSADTDGKTIAECVAGVEAIKKTINDKLGVNASTWSGTAPATWIAGSAASYLKSMEFLRDSIKLEGCQDIRDDYGSCTATEDTKVTSAQTAKAFIKPIIDTLSASGGPYAQLAALQQKNIDRGATKGRYDTANSTVEEIDTVARESMSLVKTAVTNKSAYCAHRDTEATEACNETVADKISQLEGYLGIAGVTSASTFPKTTSGTYEGCKSGTYKGKNALCWAVDKGLAARNQIATDICSTDCSVSTAAQSTIDTLLTDAHEVKAKIREIIAELNALSDSGEAMRIAAERLARADEIYAGEVAKHKKYMTTANALMSHKPYLCAYEPPERIESCTTTMDSKYRKIKEITGVDASVSGSALPPTDDAMCTAIGAVPRYYSQCKRINDILVAKGGKGSELAEIKPEGCTNPDTTGRNCELNVTAVMERLEMYASQDREADILHYENEIKTKADEARDHAETLEAAAAKIRRDKLDAMKPQAQALLDKIITEKAKADTILGAPDAITALCKRISAGSTAGLTSAGCVDQFTRYKNDLASGTTSMQESNTGIIERYKKVHASACETKYATPRSPVPENSYFGCQASQDSAVASAEEKFNEMTRLSNKLLSIVKSIESASSRRAHDVTATASAISALVSLRDAGTVATSASSLESALSGEKDDYRSRAKEHHTRMVGVTALTSDDTTTTRKATVISEIAHGKSSVASTLLTQMRQAEDLYRSTQASKTAACSKEALSYKGAETAKAMERCNGEFNVYLNAMEAEYNKMRTSKIKIDNALATIESTEATGSSSTVVALWHVVEAEERSLQINLATMSQFEPYANELSKVYAASLAIGSEVEAKKALEKAKAEEAMAAQAAAEAAAEARRIKNKIPAIRRFDIHNCTAASDYVEHSLCGYLEPSFHLQGGNSDVIQFGVDAALAYRHGKWEYGLAADSNYVHSEGSVTEDTYWAGLKIKYHYAANALYNEFAYETKELQGYRYLASDILGIEHNAQLHEDLLLQIAAGFGVRESETTAYFKKTDFTQDLRAQIAWNITQDVILDQLLTADIGNFGDALSTYNAITTLSTRISDAVALVATFEANHKSVVPMGTRHLNSSGKIGLRYEF